MPGASTRGQRGPWRPASRRARTTAAALLLGALLAGCAPGTRAPNAGLPLIVATTSILGDVASSTFGPAATVEVLIPNGADIHSSQPSAAQRARLAEADLVVLVGAGFEEGYLSTVRDVVADGVTVLEVAEQLDPLGFDGKRGKRMESDEVADASSIDPHIWLDPSRMAALPALLVDGLLTSRPELDADELQTRAIAYASELRALDEELDGLLATVPPPARTLATDHAVLGYFADRYQLRVLGSAVGSTSTSAEPSARDVATFAAMLRESRTPAIFVDARRSASLAEAIVREPGLSDVAVVGILTESLGEPGSGAESYQGLLRTLGETIARELSR